MIKNLKSNNKDLLNRNFKKPFLNDLTNIPT